MASKSKSEARENALELVNKWATATLLTGWAPGSSLLSGVGDQVMIRQIADLFGVGVFDMKAVTAHMGGAVGGSLGGIVAAELLDLVPIIGWAAKSVTLAGKAQFIGGAVIDYFEQNSPLPD